MKPIKYLMSSLIFIVINNIAWAQNEVGMADTMRSSGKIYVVIAVMLTILLGLILYVVRIDKKLSRMEKNK